jgi:hypothetical protein
MSSDHFIFVGFERTGQVDTMLSACEERDLIYLDDPMYLESIQVDGKKFVGKRIKDSAAIDRIEDTARSVVSLLGRINARWSLKPAAALVMAVDDDGAPVSEEDSEEEEGFDYSDLVE